MREPLDFLAGGARMGELIRAYDWAGSSLGPPGQWPDGLKTAVRLGLTTRHPVFVFWGPDHICLYNDAYSALVGPEKHPGMLGMAARKAWGEIWPIISPQIDKVLSGQGATWSENELIPIVRHGKLEDVYWTYSYSPIHDDCAASGVGGVMVICTETSEIVRAKRSQDEFAEAASFVNEIGEILSRLQDQDSSMQQLVRYCIGSFCDWAVIDLAEDDGSLSRHAWAHRDVDCEEALGYLSQRPLAENRSQALIQRVFTSGRAELRRPTADELDAWVAGGRRIDPDCMEPGTLVAAPLKIRGQSLGVIGFARLDAAHPYTLEELELAQEIARRAAVALDNARLYDSLQQADQAKDQFLATLSHELRNPLAPIRHAVDLLAANASRPDMITKTTGMLKRQIGQMVHLIDDLLDISRVNLGKIALRREIVSLRSIFDEVIEMTGPVCKEMHQELVELTPDIDVRVDVDTVRLVQVLGNLINNACKFSEPGNRVELDASLTGNEVIIRVRDHGIGIAPDQVSRLFRLFSQIPVADSQGDGLGIGLALSKSLVELHGGRLEVFSEGLNRGCEFSVALPVTVVDDAESAPARTDPVQTAPEANEVALGLATRSVLIVDDNEDAAMSLAMLLDQQGCEVATAFSGQQALESLLTNVPDIMLLDLGMPGMDGYEVALQVRRRPQGKEITLIALTGWGQEGDKARTLEAGFDDHLVKPVGLAELTEAMARSRRPSD